MAAAGAPGTSVRHRLLSVLALVSILLLSAWIQYSVVTHTEVEAPFRADSREYFFSAYNLTHYGVYSHLVTYPAEANPTPPPADAATAPGYPLFLALVGTPEPSDAYLHRVTTAQATLAVLTVLLLFLIASRFLRPGWSHAAALLAALSPHLAVMSTYVLTETLFTFLLFASILATLEAAQRARAWMLLLTGVLWGLCSLVRPTAEMLPVLAMAAALLLPRLRPCRRSMSVIFAGFLLVLAPWFIRTQSVAYDPARPNLAVNFVLHGSYPGFMYQGDPKSYGDPYRSDPLAPAAGRSLRGTLGYVAQRAGQAPLTYLNWYLIGKPGYFLSWTNIDGAGDIFVYSVLQSPYLDERLFDRIRLVMFWLHWPLMLLGLAAIFLLWWKPEKFGLAPGQLIAARGVSLVVAYAIGLHMVGAPFPRYGVPFRPLLYPLALLTIGLAKKGPHKAALLPDVRMT
jgi:4-amino-4-deoxy-L-arabinose transferase-like glycosyltransferase